MNPDAISVELKWLAHGEGLPVPTYGTEHAAGMDLHAAVAEDESVTLAPGGGIELIPCGFSMAVPVGYEAQVRPRSGLAVKFGISMPNAPGTIDADYRGEVCVPLINHGPEPFVVERGMRIAQMLVLPVPRVSWSVVDDLCATTRGQGGFGHTGV
ncbi:dUTP diphosphatase [Mucisphaera calidilacus]|uniref:Deoxyuridine 5'-triphosphate nucleotidohydrolase n=1 Tax=Mucisphaera calidilacus TaxID=2527982 RepID=A0A518BTS4_9BACT|nr:dUTP diphosphatase [Mucisphaera calidilacus]QDU70364.1 Deoxyuridine 5'-triphosphate nucleotidohydrolase [Mucisphaera calidilacus]